MLNFAKAEDRVKGLKKLRLSTKLIEAFYLIQRGYKIDKDIKLSDSLVLCEVDL